MKGIMSIGVDHARHAVAEVEHLHPDKDRARRLARIDALRRSEEDFVGRMDLDTIDEAEHSLESAIGRAVGVAVAEHLDEVRVVHLDNLLGAVIPQSQPLDLRQGAVVVMDRPATILRKRLLDDREGVLVIDRQE